jgi:protein-S-isoprenylcysteine O-methyltransferase Ste14
MARDQAGRPHEKRDDLTGEHALTDIGQLVFAVLFFAAWIGDSFILRLTVFLNDHVSIIIRAPIAVCVVGLALYMARASHAAIFGGKRQSSSLVRQGVFAVTRHPMYLSEILIYLGFLLFSMSLMAAGVWLALIGFLHYTARQEEQLLRTRFGDEYVRYRQEVPMWILYRRPRK